MLAYRNRLYISGIRSPYPQIIVPQIIIEISIIRNLVDSPWSQSWRAKGIISSILFMVSSFSISSTIGLSNLASSFFWRPFCHLLFFLSNNGRISSDHFSILPEKSAYVTITPYAVKSDPDRLNHPQSFKIMLGTIPPTNKIKTAGKIKKNIKLRFIILAFMCLLNARNTIDCYVPSSAFRLSPVT